MKRLLSKVIFVLVAALMCSTAYSESNISVIDLNRTLSASNYAQQELQALKSNPEYKKLIDAIKGLQKELGDLQKKGETESLTWSDEQKQQHVSLMQGKFTQFNQLGNQQAEIQKQLERKVEQTLTPKIEEIVNVIIEEKGISLLLTSKAVFYRKPEYDITQEVIDRLNKSN